MGLEIILGGVCKMKMLVVAHNSFLDGGANRSLLMVLDILKNKYKVNLIVLLPSDKGPMIDQLNKLNIKWLHFKYYGCTSNIRHDKYDILRFGRISVGYLIEVIQGYRISKILKHEKLDLVYTNTRVTCIGAKIANNLKIPHVCHVREFGSVRPLWGFWGYKSLYKSSKKVILISYALKNKFLEYVSGEKLVTIHNGIESDLNLNVCFDKKKDTVDILLTARIDPEKGHFDALNAIKHLKEKGYRNLKLHIAGSESNTAHINWYKESICNFIIKNNLEDIVILHGEVVDMRFLREHMDIELMCAVCETFGRVTVEGMRNGLCVIGSNTGGTTEIIKHNVTGLLYEQGNFLDLAEKIETILKDKNKRIELAKNGYKYANEHFTPDKNVESIYNVLLESCE